MDNVTPAQRIPHILKNYKTIAVVGLSHKPHRASFDVARYMQGNGYRIIPINPNETQVLGEKAYATLLDAAAHEKIDLVNCFRNSQDIPPIVDEAIAIGAKARCLDGKNEIFGDRRCPADKARGFEAGIIGAVDLNRGQL